jgi:Fe-S-cluster-containing dehydrogenase component
MKSDNPQKKEERTIVEVAKIVQVVEGVATEKSVEVIKEISPKTTSPNRYILVDDMKCSYCMSCMLACSLAHEGKTSLSSSRIQVITNPLERFPLDVVHKWNHEKNTAMQCDFCADAPYWDGDEPACVAVCPMQAITVTNEIPARLGE